VAQKKDIIRSLMADQSPSKPASTSTSPHDRERQRKLEVALEEAASQNGQLKAEFSRLTDDVNRLTRAVLEAECATEDARERAKELEEEKTLAETAQAEVSALLQSSEERCQAHEASIASLRQQLRLARQMDALLLDRSGSAETVPAQAPLSAAVGVAEGEKSGYGKPQQQSGAHEEATAPGAGARLETKAAEAAAGAATPDSSTEMAAVMAAAAAAAVAVETVCCDPVEDCRPRESRARASPMAESSSSSSAASADTTTAASPAPGNKGGDQGSDDDSPADSGATAKKDKKKKKKDKKKSKRRGSEYDSLP
jgi:hypothetical protein